MGTLRTQRFPDEFEALLSARGRRVLRGKDDRARGALSRGAFFTGEGLVHSRWAHHGAELLEQAFGELMTELVRELPSPFGSVASGMELLPKVCRMWTSPTTPEALARSEECGLLQMLRSDSYLAFAHVLAGRPVRGPEHLQALCYRKGDYAGPHTDNHPHEPTVRHGYIDVHLTFCTRGVERQLLVYQQGAHLTEVASLATSGAITAYRLPFWHYTTPLEVKHPSARRWLVLGTFLDA
ncbi:MAG: hypothetical protein AMXMBFR34_11950 [Myxococcaceae bacterium]